MKLANKRYTSIKNDYCLTFDQNADVVEADEDNSIKKQGFSFVGLKEIQGIVQAQAVDVIGIVVDIGQIGNIVIKATGLPRSRRTIQLGDESGLKIQATLWGNLANMFDLQIGQVFAIKNARVSDYGGKSLNCGDDTSTVYIEPDHFRTIDLQRWYAANGDSGLQSLSTGAGTGDGTRND